MTFPTHVRFEGHSWTESSPPPEFRSLFAKVLKPADILDSHKQALNITVLPACPVDEFIPAAPDGTSYLPEDTTPPGQDIKSYAEAAGANSVESKKRKDFDERVAELRIENDTAFRAITRTVVEGVRPPRLAYMRKFWEGLENMSPYWDCSLDRYYEKEDDGCEKSAKRQRLGSVSNVGNHSEAFEADRPLPLLNGSKCCDDQENHDPQHESNDEDTDHAVDSSGTLSSTTTRMRYKGRRTGTGRGMPDQFRTDTVRGFVEGTIWPFQASLSAPRRMPLVQFNKLNLPVRQTAAVYRLPRDRLKGRQGWLEGPIVTIQARPETDFEGEDKDAEGIKARLDLMREIGGILQIAQERRREGTNEVKPGEGQWYTSKPRWGGGAGGEAENEIGKDDILQTIEESLRAAEGLGNRREKNSGKTRKAKTPALLWKELKCGSGYWDSRTDYSAIGKSLGSNYDEVR